MLLIFIAVSILSAWVSNTLKSKFKTYSALTLQNGLSGKEIAEQMLLDHGIRGVRVQSVSGQLTDHYNPVQKTINLSEQVYYKRNASAAAVAAHECGHAVQHAQSYQWLQLRTALVPVVQFASQFSVFFILGGLGLWQISPWGFNLGLLGIGIFGLGALFSLLTLPVEFDASHRALQWLQRKNMVTQQERAAAQDALKWAAMTYVVAALGALATLLYFVSQFLGSNRD